MQHSHSSKLIITQANLNDLPALGDLWQREFNSAEVPNLAMCVIYVAKETDTGKIVGVTTIQPVVFLDMWIDPNYRGRGVFLRFVNRLKSTPMKYCYAAITNHKFTRELMQRFGFSKFGDWKVYKWAR